jgi:hypothetical protein
MSRWDLLRGLSLPLSSLLFNNFAWLLPPLEKVVVFDHLLQSLIN